MYKTGNYPGSSREFQMLMGILNTHPEDTTNLIKERALSTRERTRYLKSTEAPMDKRTNGRTNLSKITYFVLESK